MSSRLALFVVVTMMLGCSAPRSENDLEKMVSCARLLDGQSRDLQDVLNAGEEPKDPEVRRCLALHREYAVVYSCLREHRDEPLEHYACVHDQLGQEGKKSAGGGKHQRCVNLYTKVMACSKDVSLLEEMGKAFGNKDKFIAECKKHWKEAQEMTDCAAKRDCREFTKCMLKLTDEDFDKMEGLKKRVHTPADKPVEPPADPPTDPPAPPPSGE